MIGLNIAASQSTLPGWINLDRYGQFPDVRADLRQLPFATGSFDVLLFAHVLEHIPWPDVCPALAEAMRVLHPGGMIWVATPDVAVSSPTLLYGGIEPGWAHLWPTSRETWSVTLNSTDWDWEFVDEFPHPMPGRFPWPGPEVLLRVEQFR